jgi:glycoprotein endo-alpha-1,2-mannosidase
MTATCMKLRQALSVAAVELLAFGLMSCGDGSSSPPSAPDFTLSVSPGSVSTEVGGTTAPFTVSVNSQNGFSGTVNITIDGFPNGIEPSPTPPLSLSPGATQQVAFAAPAAAGTFTVTFHGAGGPLTHTATATLKITPKPSPFLVAASYYPWYTPADFDYVECYLGTLRYELSPPQPPILGKYDSRQQDVVTQHIAWSTAAGVNVWAMEWVQPDDFLDATIRNFILPNPHISDIRFAIIYDYAIRFNGDFNLTSAKVDTMIADFKYLAKTYFVHPSYLTVDQNRPVVFIYVTRALNPVSSVQQMASAIRAAMVDAGWSVYLIGDEYYALTPPNPTRIAIWDGIFGYDVYLRFSGYSDDNGYLALHRTRHDEYQATAQQLGVDFVASLMPGFNDRAVRRVCANNPALARRTSAAAQEGSMFRSFLRDIALPHALNSKLKMLHITSFNEWHEDTQIEPSVITAPTTTSPTGTQYTQGLIYEGYGALYLDIIRNEIAAASANGTRQQSISRGGLGRGSDSKRGGRTP